MSKTFGANTLKYLARAYLCNISELSIEKMPPNLLLALKEVVPVATIAENDNVETAENIPA